MDNVPYEFVDRVLTKLNADDIRTLKLDAPIWKEASRIYNNRLQLIHVYVWMDTGNGGMKFLIKNADRTEFTVDDWLQMDSRVNRVCELHIGFKNLNVMTAELRTVLEHVFRFDLDIVGLQSLEEASSDVHKALTENDDMRTEELRADYFLGGEDFLKKLLRNSHLRRLILVPGNYWSSLLNSDLEAFVCRPQFQVLNCTFECFDNESFKRIVAYWKTVQPTEEWTIDVLTSHNMTDEFKPWLGALSDDGGEDPIFCERIGDFSLRVWCRDNSCSLSLLYKFDVD